MFFFGDDGLTSAKTKRAKSTEKAGCPTHGSLPIDGRFSPTHMSPEKMIKIYLRLRAQTLRGSLEKQTASTDRKRICTRYFLSGVYRITSSTAQSRMEQMSLSVASVILRLCFKASSVPLLKEYLVISVYVVTPFFFIVSHKGSKVINRISSLP